MNPKMKIAAAVAGALVAGTALVGTAFAAPRVLAPAPAAGYSMMRPFSGLSAVGTPSVADMNAFMNRYRNNDGSIDVDRMRADVRSGAVTTPCASATPRGTSVPGSRAYGPGMMRGSGAARGPARGYGMMSSSF